MLSGAITALVVIVAFILGSVYGKSIKIEVTKPEFDGEYIEQPRLQDPEVERYFQENGGYKF